jgi:hypothetical protein
LPQEEQDALEEMSLLKAPGGSKNVSYLFDGMYGSWSDEHAGALMLFIALTILCVCLYLIVRTLKSLLRGRVAVWLHKTVNGQVPDLQLTAVRREDGNRALGKVTVPFGWLSGYLAMAAVWEASMQVSRIMHIHKHALTLSHTHALTFTYIHTTRRVPASRCSCNLHRSRRVH